MDKIDTREDINIVKILSKYNDISVMITEHNGIQYVTKSTSTKSFIHRHYVLEYNILQEIQKLKSKHLPILYDMYYYTNTSSGKKFLCYDMKLYKGSLYDLYIEYSKNNLNFNEVVPKLYSDIRKGLDDIHSIGISHNDIKLENIVYECKEEDMFNPNNITFILIDFDHSNYKDTHFSNCIGLYRYASPYIIMCKYETALHESIVEKHNLSLTNKTFECDYDYVESDLWSLACLIYSIYTGFSIVNIVTDSKSILSDMIECFRNISINDVSNNLLTYLVNNSDIDSLNITKFIIKTIRKGLEFANKTSKSKLTNNYDNNNNVITSEYNYKDLAFKICPDYKSYERTLKIIENIVNNTNINIDNYTKCMLVCYYANYHGIKKKYFMDTIDKPLKITQLFNGQEVNTLNKNQININEIIINNITNNTFFNVIKS